jgi:hypothetical protein
MSGNPIQALFEAAARTADYPPESRYHGVEVATWTAPDGAVFAHLARRFVPDPDAFATLRERVAGEGERLDRLAAAEFGDPAAWWRLCDASGAIWPETLETPGARVRVTLPAGVAAAEEG